MVRKTKKMAAQQFMVKQTKRVRALAPVPTDSVVREQLNCRAMPRDPESNYDHAVLCTP